ncbi:MAG: flippase-like domain-containing protein [Desulfurococcales archaeon]|nr:flippase-like domain-containing protein [Desulfurococcales archaeon]
MLTGVYRDFTGFISGVGMKYYSIAIVIYVTSTFAWAFRWWFILKRLGNYSSFKDVYVAIMGGILVNNISPSLRMGGEGFRAAWLWIKHKTPFDRSILAILYERLTEIPGVAVVIGIAIAGGVLGNFSGSITEGLGFGLIGLGFFDGTRGLIRDVKKRLKTDSKMLVRDKTLTISASTISILIWLQDIFRFYFIGLAVGIHLKLPEAALLSIGYLIFGMAPTPAGLGFVEGGLTSILVGLGYSIDKAGLLVLGERLISSVIASVLGLVLVSISGGIHAFKLALKISGKAEESEEYGDSESSFGV